MSSQSPGVHVTFWGLFKFLRLVPIWKVPLILSPQCVSYELPRSIFSIEMIWIRPLLQQFTDEPTREVNL